MIEIVAVRPDSYGILSYPLPMTRISSVDMVMYEVSVILAKTTGITALHSKCN